MKIFAQSYRNNWGTTCFVVLSLALALNSGCGKQNSSSDSPRQSSTTKTRLSIVCTTGMVADLARNVGKSLSSESLIEVIQLMGDETDPHLYKTSPGDISLMQRADVILYSGLHLEGKMGQLFENLARRKKVLAVGELLPEDRILRIDEHFADPHVWFDVELWSHGIDGVAKLLTELFADHRDRIQKDAGEYRDTLRKLDERCRNEIAAIPASQRVMITAHDAFHYWGKAYGIEVRAIQGISTESEAGVRQINDLVKFINERKIKAVFIETTISDRAVLALIEGCSHAGHKVIVGGSLYSDAMGKPGTPEGTYTGMVEHNLRTIVQALK